MPQYVGFFFLSWAAIYFCSPLRKKEKAVERCFLAPNILLVAGYASKQSSTWQQNKLCGHLNISYHQAKALKRVKILRQAFQTIIHFLFFEDMTKQRSNKSRIQLVIYSIELRLNVTHLFYNAFKYSSMTHCNKRLFKLWWSDDSYRYVPTIQWNVELFLTTDENDIIVDMVTYTISKDSVYVFFFSSLNSIVR